MPFKKGTSRNPTGRPLGSIISSTKLICDRNTIWNISKSTDKQLVGKLLSLYKNKHNEKSTTSSVKIRKIHIIS